MVRESRRREKEIARMESDLGLKKQGSLVCMPILGSRVTKTKVSRAGAGTYSILGMPQNNSSSVIGSACTAGYEYAGIAKQG